MQSKERLQERKKDSLNCKKNKEVLIFKNADEMSDFTISKWAEISEGAIKSKGRFEVAISGGKTPEKLYQKLSGFKRPLPWDKTHIFLVDERFVSHKSNESNYRMINQLLLKHIKIPKENIHPIPVGEKTSQAAAKKYEDNLISYFKLACGGFPMFDLIFLGIGEDGHTASLFPDTPALKGPQHMATAVMPEEMSKHKRITLTFPVINNAKNIIFLVTGSNKAKVVKEILEEKNSVLPAARIKPKDGKLFFLLDKGAASYLK